MGRGGEVHPSPVFAPPPARDDPSPRRRAPGRRDRGGDAADARRARVPRGGHGRVRERPRGGPHRVQRRRVHRERAQLGGSRGEGCRRARVQGTRGARGPRAHGALLRPRDPRSGHRGRQRGGVRDGGGRYGRRGVVRRPRARGGGAPLRRIRRRRYRTRAARRHPAAPRRRARWMAAWGRGRCGWAWWGGRGAAHDPARAREVPRHVGAVRSSRRLGVCSVRG